VTDPNIEAAREIARAFCVENGIPPDEGVSPILEAGMRAMATAAVRCAAWLIPPNDEEVREIVDRMMETDEIRELLQP
jgi:hypothetical protein